MGPESIIFAGDTTMEPSQAGAFLDAFNSIDKELRRVTKLGREQRGFPQVVAAASKISRVVRMHEADLLEFAELRNAIVHDRMGPNEIIAEPHPKAVERIQAIDRALTSPPKVFPMFSKQVEKLELGDPLSKALALHKSTQFSQFPVYDRNGQFKGLLTERCISAWLSQSVKDDGIILIGSASVGEVLERDETKGGNVRFVSRDATWYDAAELFSRDPASNKLFLEAVLVTQTGDPSQALLGIITPWDLLQKPE